MPDDLGTTDANEQARRLTRRRLLQGGAAAAVAGAVWVTPAIETMAQPAGGVGSGPLPELTVCDSAVTFLLGVSPSTANFTSVFSVNFTTSQVCYQLVTFAGNVATELDLFVSGASAAILVIPNPAFDGSNQCVTVSAAVLADFANFCTSPNSYSATVKTSAPPNGESHGSLVGATNCCQGFQGGIPNRCYAPASPAWCDFWYGGPNSVGTITTGPCTIKASGRGCCAGTANCS